MARGSHEFVLVGYSEYLERRPLKFVDPIPATLICSACGHIPRLTFFLLCGHVLCEPCYQGSATTSECVCPLDGEVSGRGDVSSKKYPAEILLKRKVHCWNEVNGCRVVLPASQLTEHVRQDCQHHVTRCPKCLAAVLCRDVCAHLKSRCTALVLQAAPEAQQGTDNNENSHFAAFEREVKERVRELDARLLQLSLESGSQNDKLVGLCHNVNHLNETLKEQFEALTRQFELASVQSIDRLNRNEAEMNALVAHEKKIGERVGDLDAKLTQLSLKSDSLSEKLNEICHNNNHLKEALTEQFGTAVDRKVAEIKSLYAQKIEPLTTAGASALASVPSDTKTLQRVVTGYAALKKQALKVGWSWSMSDKVYLRRYHMSWGIHLYKHDESLRLELCIQLHEGREDDFLDWPFTKELKLSIIHPETRQERNLVGKPIPSEANNKYYSRPINNRNVPARFDKSSVESSDIEREGYVKEDQLLLRFEILL